MRTLLRILAIVLMVPFAMFFGSVFIGLAQLLMIIVSVKTSGGSAISMGYGYNLSPGALGALVCTLCLFVVGIRLLVVTGKTGE